MLLFDGEDVFELVGLFKKLILIFLHIIIIIVYWGVIVFILFGIEYKDEFEERGGVC